MATDMMEDELYFLKTEIFSGKRYNKKHFPGAPVAVFLAVPICRMHSEEWITAN